MLGVQNDEARRSQNPYLSWNLSQVLWNATSTLPYATLQVQYRYHSRPHILSLLRHYLVVLGRRLLELVVAIASHWSKLYLEGRPVVVEAGLEFGGSVEGLLQLTQVLVVGDSFSSLQPKAWWVTLEMSPWMQNLRTEQWKESQRAVPEALTEELVEDHLMVQAVALRG